MKFDSKYPWYIFDMAVFTALNGILLWQVYARGFRVAITPFQLVLLGLAVYRGANVIANEGVMRPLRAPFVRLVKDGEKVTEEPYASGFRGAMGALLYCLSCCGMWVAMALAYGYLFWPRIFSVIILILALSALERVLAGCMQLIKVRASHE